MSISIKKWKLYVKMFYQCFTSFSKPRYAHFFGDEELIDFITKERKTLIRYGDGEFDIIEGKSIHYQDYNPYLKNELDTILQEYLNGSESIPYIIAMPEHFINCTGFRILFSRLRLSSWSHVRYLFYHCYDKDVQYGNAFLFCRENEPIYSKIWMKADIRKIMFIHNNIKYAKYFEQKYNIETVYVEIPPLNAYESVDEILLKIEKECTIKENIMALISAGPCGKILAYKLAKKGIWSIDTGHCWDDPLDKNK